MYSDDVVFISNKIIEFEYDFEKTQDFVILEGNNYSKAPADK